MDGAVGMEYLTDAALWALPCKNRKPWSGTMVHNLGVDPDH